jgi:hypothetical protein
MEREGERLAFAPDFLRLDPEPIQLKRLRVQILQLSMILSENRFPLFGIML